MGAKLLASRYDPRLIGCFRDRQLKFIYFLKAE